MAALSDTDRFKVWANFMRQFPVAGTTTKQEFRTVLNAVDNWVDANSGSFNNALPVAYRTAADLQEKTKLLSLVIMQRAGLG